MSEHIFVIPGSEFDNQQRHEWCLLFSKCYKTDMASALLHFQKYLLNQSIICFIQNSKGMIAAYNGLVLELENWKIFLSTDTMSDGTTRSATVKLAAHLYPLLQSQGISAVCGYPNPKIIKIREKRLGWSISGNMHLWVSAPLLWRIGAAKDRQGLWSARRPSSGFFGKPRVFLTPVSNGKVLVMKVGIPFTLATNRPGPFYIKIPRRIVAPKVFGYRILTNDVRLDEKMRSAATRLDLLTIDLP